MDATDSSKKSIKPLNKFRREEYLDAEGRLHRNDGPAIIEMDGYQAWYRHGLRHREDGPARIWCNGTKEWYLYGQKHRVGAPAVTYEDGTEIWYEFGLRHRIDGPAYIDDTGQMEFWLDNKRLASWHEFQQYAKCSDEHILILTLKYGELK